MPVRQKSARSVENSTAAEASVEESPNVSLTRRSQALVNFAKWPTSLQNKRFF